MRVLSFLLLVTLSFASSATIESSGRICIQGGPVPTECPNNYKWNSVTCRFECKPHCISNEGNFIFPSSYGTTYNRQCKTCTCKPDGTTTDCSPKLCVNKCFDDAGNTYAIGDIMTSGCKTGICTSVNGKATWSWYSPASASVKPNCPYGPGLFNNATCKWECPSTCPDGSSPRKCAQGGVPLPPCSVVRCGFNTECTDNYCPNYPNNNRTACTATCVSPALCTKDPCQTTPDKPKCGKNQACTADYRFGCGYQCRDVCFANGQTYEIGDTRPEDCNTCTCLPNGGWGCTKRACPAPNVCVQGGPTPSQCPNNYQWNDKTCQFECVCPQNQNCGINGVWDYDACRCIVNTPAPSTPICAQGGAVPSECPNNNRWNSTTCRFECVCKQNQNCGINGVWDYDACRCVVNTPATVATPTCAVPQKPRCDFAPAVFNTTSCKYYCPRVCADGSQPVACTINPCAAALCARNTQCRANYCGGCNAECKTIEPTVQCFAEPCKVNSCDNGQTCVNEYDGGCNYRCI